MVKDDFGEGLAVERQRDPPIGEEGTDPVAQGGGEAEESEDVNQLIDM